MQRQHQRYFNIFHKSIISSKQIIRSSTNKQSMQLINAISLQGYLSKQSPGVIKIYQKRYFAIRNNGQFIVWFGKKPSTIDVEPKGIIITIKIDAIKPDDFDERIFTLNYNNRWFILKAENKDSRDRWLRSISVIIDHLKKTLKTKLSEIKSKPTDWKFENASEEVVKSIRLENEKLILREGEDGLLEKSGKQLMSIIGFNASSDIEKCIAFGFLNKKGFIGSDQKWYFIVSEFNLSDERDDNFNEKIKPFFDGLNNASSQKKKESTREASSSEQSSQQQKQKKDGSKYQVNYLYEFDLKTNSMTLQLSLTDLISFTKDISQNPYLLKISYGVFDEKDVDADETVKQFTLQSDYMSQIQKWFKAIQIIFQRYSITKIREALLQKRFQKFQMKMIKMNEDTEWRILGSSTKPEFVFVNQEVIKVSGHSFPIAEISKQLITTRMSILFKENPTDEGKEKEATTLIIYFRENKRLQLVFQNKQAVKTLKKKLKKYMKNRSEDKQMKTVQLQKKENNEDTYLIDKKIREASSSIKINFYEMMDREVSTMKQQKQPKPQSFFDKFVNMFCGPPKEEDVLYY